MKNSALVFVLLVYTLTHVSTIFEHINISIFVSVWDHNLQRLLQCFAKQTVQGPRYEVNLRVFAITYHR